MRSKNLKLEKQMVKMYQHFIPSNFKTQTSKTVQYFPFFLAGTKMGNIMPT